MKISDSLLNILLTLRADPAATHEKLAKKLGIAPNTVKARIKKLQEMGIIRRHSIFDDQILGKREYSEVVGIYSPASIGLFRLHIIFENAQIEKLDPILDKHPYTYYKVHIYGSGTAIYAQMDIPKDSVKPFKELLQECTGKLYTAFKTIEPRYFVNTQDNLNLIDEEFKRWNYDVPRFIPETKSTNKSPYDREIISMKPLDLKLLRELTINGRVQLSKIKDDYEVDLSTLSRRTRRLKEKGCIQTFNLIYDRSAFNLDSAFLLIGKIHDINAYTNQFSEFPFLSNLAYDKYGNFIWYVYCPTSTVGQLYAELKRLGEVEIRIVHQEKGIRYYFYPQNYNQNGWKSDEEYLKLCG